MPGGSAIFKKFMLQQDTFLVTGPGAVVKEARNPLSKFSLQVYPVGAVTAWTVVLYGSLDNVHFDDILTHTELSGGPGGIVWSGSNSYPALYFKAVCTALTLGDGTSIKSIWLGIP